MASVYKYNKTISNTYLNKTKVIKANSLYELKIKVDEQISVWAKQEATLREREANLQLINDLKQKTDKLNDINSKRLEEYRSILSQALGKKLYVINWEKKKKTFSYPMFSFRNFLFEETPPAHRDLTSFYKEFKVPKKSFFEKIFRNRVTIRLEKEAVAKSEFEKWSNEYKTQIEQYNKRRDAAKDIYEKERNDALEKYNADKAKTENEINEFNAQIDVQKNDFKNGVSTSLAPIIQECLNKSKYPSDFVSDFEVEYTNNDKIAVISVNLPNINAISNIREYKYVNSTKTIKEVEFKKKDFDDLYNLILKQIALRTLYETFSYDKYNNINIAVFNGWVDGIDRATGKEFNACILSVQMSRDDFENINFQQIDVDACIKSLKGLLVGNLAELVPVKPIMEINSEDSRFVASKDILDSLGSGDNLATMDWEDFEHLVRELFSKYFSDDGQNVQVTQSSRDGGVDAIAFDPDPIRGGKFVIQAKRYNRVVPVSAVRDLYGTMINEGAAKGILVTTSYFGSDSRNFVKDKPITLIDGSNLIHMFSQYGYDVHIKLQN